MKDGSRRDVPLGPRAEPLDIREAELQMSGNPPVGTYFAGWGPTLQPESNGGAAAPAETSSGSATDKPD